jgi:membrane protein YdbS with pleckstrin-like domain
MENASQVGINALRYRLFLYEIVGITISIILTLFLVIFLYFMKNKYALFIDAAFFVGICVVQFVIIYYISLMQYKNLKYFIGENAITFQCGTFGVYREIIPLEKIRNSTFNQSFIQRLFSVGSIMIDQSDEKYIWESIDATTANLISNIISARSDVQPITFQEAGALMKQQPPSSVSTQ